MKSLFCTLAIFFFLLAPAKSQNKNSVNSIQIIDIEANINNVQKLNLSQFTNEIRYVPLETREDARLKNVSNLDFSDNLIITSDGNSILLYDLSGHFIKKFGSKGLGPEEYQYIRNLTITKDKKICFSSNLDFLEFNSTGSFEHKYSNLLLINKKYPLLNWQLVDDTLIFGDIDNTMGQVEFKALLINKKGSIKQTYKNYDLLKFEEHIFNGQPCLSPFDGSVFYKKQFSDTLYFLNQNYDLIPRYFFNLGNLRVTLDSRFFPPTTQDYVSIYNIFQTENYLLLRVLFDKKYKYGVLGIFNKNTKDLIFCQPNNDLLTLNGISNDIDAGPSFYPSKTVNNNTFVMTISAKQLKDHVASDDFKNNAPKQPEKKKQLEELANKLTENDNPILILVTFKK